MSNSSPEPARLDLRPLPGSEQRALPRAIRATDPVPAHTVLEVTLVLRRRAELPDPAAAAPVPRTRFAADYGADPADIELVTAAVGAFLHSLAGSLRLAGVVALVGAGIAAALLPSRPTLPVEIDEDNELGAPGEPGAVEPLAEPVLVVEPGV